MTQEELSSCNGRASALAARHARDCRSAEARRPPGGTLGERYVSDGFGAASFGRLFKNDLRLYVYPYLDPATQKLVTVDNLEVPPELQKLYGHLVDRSCIQQLKNHDPQCLSIFSRDVLERIKTGDPSWEAMVPPEIAEVIKRRCFFGYRRDAEPLAPEPKSRARYEN